MTSDGLMMELMKYAIVVAGLSIAISGVIVFRKHKTEDFRWVCLVLSGMGLYWASYYLQSILKLGLQSHQIYVRGPLLFTLSMIAALFIILLRRK